MQGESAQGHRNMDEDPPFIFIPKRPEATQNETTRKDPKGPETTRKWTRRPDLCLPTERMEMAVRDFIGPAANRKDQQDRNSTEVGRLARSGEVNSCLKLERCCWRKVGTGEDTYGSVIHVLTILCLLIPIPLLKELAPPQVGVPWHRSYPSTACGGPQLLGEKGKT